MTDAAAAAKAPKSVLERLASLDTDHEFAKCTILGEKPVLEDCLRRALRPHVEAGFLAVSDQWMVKLREALDEELQKLTVREIRCQLGLPVDDLSPETISSLETLFGSEAFLRYLDVYLYFGIRFMADRKPFALSGKLDAADFKGMNRRPLPLCYPPTLHFTKSKDAVEDLLRHLENDTRRPVCTALRFLDGYHPFNPEDTQYELEEPTQFELWLRGLKPEVEDDKKLSKRFERIAEGLESWALDRGAFYLTFGEQRTIAVRLEDGESGASTPAGTPGVDEDGCRDNGEEADAANTKDAGKEKKKVAERRPPGGWLVTDPIAARLVLADLYWIARLLRADVSTGGRVKYQKYNWLHFLRFNALLQERENKDQERKNKDAVDALQKAEDTLRSVFDFACDLIQNADELTREKERSTRSPENYPPLPWPAAKWREVFDEELDEIDAQRKVRHFMDPSSPPQASGGASTGSSTPPAAPGSEEKHPARTCRDAESWSRRVITGKRPLNLIGLAFSGGGIRSATVNLGVLQGLQELDLLRHIDYISTVSGGGFIGAWLIANVRRTAHWLGRLTDWKDSITHLRDYSNYLAPRTGVLSADTWNLANSWFRNAILIQLTGLATLFALLLATLMGVRGFLAMGRGVPHLGLHLSMHPGAWHPGALFPGATLALVVGLLAAVATFVSLLSNLTEAAGRSGVKTAGSEWVKWSTVVPAWIGGFALASHFWVHAQPAAAATWHCISSATHYSTIVKGALIYWWPIWGGSLAGFTTIAWRTLPQKKGHAFWIGPFCTVVLYLELAGIFYLFLQWSGLDGLAVVFGPALFLAAFTLCILLLIGFTGRYTGEAVREWWTRYGTWLGVFAVVGMFLTAVAVYAPLWLFPINEHAPLWAKIKWSAVAGWVASVIGSLFAGKSSKTEGTGNSKSPLIELAAKIGGLLFIIGSFILGSTLLYVLLFEIFGPDNELSVTYSDVFLTRAPELAFSKIFLGFIVAAFLVWLFSEFFEINIFGLNQFYRNRLVRCYLGASRWMPGMRSPNAFTGFDFDDDLYLSQFRTKAKVPGNPGYYRGPLPLINCSLNLAGSADLALNTRHSASFTLTPLHCGSDRPKVGYAPTEFPPPPCSGFAGAVRLGQAVAISGAAVSSNMGYNTSPLVAFLLTMFNVRLGWWFPNPSKGSWSYSGLRSSFVYLFAELFGVAGEKRHYLNISDGGHFENLAIYELIRRRCRLIIACDAECDERLEFGGLGNLIRICETDLGATIEIDVKSIRPHGEKRGLAHCAVGLIKYSSGELGRLIYLKASVTGDEDVSILQYASSHPTFPHESTADQFFSEDQFESYRMLGQHMVRSSFKGNVAGDDPLMVAEKMVDVLTPAGCSTEAFLRHSSSLAAMWEKFRACKPLQPFMKELISLGPKVPPIAITEGELCIGLELIQLMEDVFMDLRLDDFWDHPDNRGWAVLFMRWARSPRFRMIWTQTHRTYGIRFEYFCHSRLGLERDQPIVRV